MWFANNETTAPASGQAAILLDSINNKIGGFPARIPEPESTYQLQAGDDPTPPNGVSQDNLNGIAAMITASAGFSTAPPRGIFHPSAVHFDLNVTSSSLDVVVSIEFENPHYTSSPSVTTPSSKFESMVVKAKVAKSIVIPASQKPLQLLSTSFQDWNEIRNEWIDISTKIAYAAQAEAVVAAVIATATDQTAGMASVKNESFDVTLGPVGLKGRMLLKFSCGGAPYSYDAMGLATDGSDIGKGKLIPIALFLPWAPLADHNGTCAVSFKVTAPSGAQVLPPNTSTNAYHHLHSQSFLSNSTMVAVGSLKQGTNAATAEYAWSCLPITPTFVLTWLALPNDEDDFGFELLDVKDVPQEKPMKATILKPAPHDVNLLTQSMPGGGYKPGQLTRIRIQTPKLSMPRTNPQFILNIGLSDASGSTSCHSISAQDSATVRSKFNKMTERRLLKRLSSIPALLEAGILQLQDVWADMVIVFDGTARDQRTITFKVSDFQQSSLVQDSAGNVSVASIPGLSPASLVIARQVVDFIKWIQGVQPGGWTDFVVPANAANQRFPDLLSQAQQLAGPNLVVKSFIDFDTDGGHNGTSGNACTALSALIEGAKVKNGIVTGFGSWVDQDCASKMAELLGPNPALLGLHVPEIGQEGMDRIFSTGFVAWVDALRHESFELSISAGATTGGGDDALQILSVIKEKGVLSQKLAFGAPDVSNVEYTGATISGVASGDSLLLYAVQLVDDKTLLESLQIKVNGSVLPVVRDLKDEKLQEHSLAFEWLQIASKKDSQAVWNSSVAVSSLLSRIEDNVSFAYNMPSLSGSTAYLGRTKNAGNRKNVDKAHLPSEPSDGTSQEYKEAQSRNQLMTQPFGSSYPIQQGVYSFGAPRRALQAVPSGGFSSGGFGGATTGLFGGAYQPAQQLQQQLQSRLFNSTQSAAVNLAPPPPPVASLFGGTPAAAPGSALFGASPAASSFGRPSATMFKKSKQSESSFGQQQAFSPRQSTTPSSPLAWSSILTRTSHLKLDASSNILSAPLESLLLLRHNFVKMTVGVPYVCDWCNCQFEPNMARFHCFDCEDFDECAQCHGRHIQGNPLHRVFDITGISSASSTVPSQDPLIAKLLATTPATTTTPTTANAKPKNRTTEIEIQKAKRLLLAMLTWWSVVHKWLPSPGALPDVLDEVFPAEMARAFANGSAVDLSAIGVKIVDTLEREAGLKTAA